MEGAAMMVKALRRRPCRFSTLAVVVLLAGCAASRSPSPGAETAVADLQPTFTDRRITDCLATPLRSQRPCRDTIVQSLLFAIDSRYAEYEANFLHAHRAGRFGSALAAIGLDTAGPLTSPGTKRVLDAMSSAVTGARDAYAREMMGDQSAAAQVIAMRAERDAIGLRIREGLQAAASRYPLGVALSDLHAYRRAGTPAGALAAGTQTSNSETSPRRTN
jgi:hypothetical protein